MKSICYIIPFFGKLPGKAFQLWLTSCKANPTVNWLIYTDDKTAYNYPENVAVKYCSYEEMLEKLQNNFDEKIEVKTPWHLSLFKPAYGEIFSDDLIGYDFWGYCDIDLMWGDIRRFFTEEILEKYDRIGFYGHSTIFRNTPEVNARYKVIVPGELNYKDAFFKGNRYSFDENGIDAIYNYLDIPYFQEIIFANLTKYERKFHLDAMPDEDEYKNNRQVFTWKNGRLARHYLHGGKIFDEEFLYIHFWCRPMSYKISKFTEDTEYLIYSDVVSDKPFQLTKSLINRKGISHPISFYAKSLWKNRHKLTPERIIFNIKGALGKNN